MKIVFDFQKNVNIFVTFTLKVSSHRERSHTEQGWHSCESTRLPQMWPKSRCRRHLWVEFCCWFSSLLRKVLSPGTPVFPSPQKPTFSNPNSIRNQVDEEQPSGCAASKSLFIYWSFGKPIWRIGRDVMWKRSIKSQNIETYGLSTYIPKGN